MSGRRGGSRPAAPGAAVPMGAHTATLSTGPRWQRASMAGSSPNGVPMGAGCPFPHGAAAGPQPLPGAAGESDYEKYMQVGSLLSLQKPEASRVHHDELM